MIPVRAAIEEQAWLVVDNSSYSATGVNATEIRRITFQFKPLELSKVNPASIDHKDRIKKLINIDCLHLLKIDLVVLTVEPLEGYAFSTFNKCLSLKDEEGFTFKPIYDDHLCAHSDIFSKQSGLSKFYSTMLFNPKIRYKASMLFELPEASENLNFIATYGEIREA